MSQTFGNLHLPASIRPKTAKHLFCKICGVKSFYVPRSHPNGYSVNARCLEKDRIDSMHISESNGKDWEKLYPEGRGAYS